MNQSRMRGKLCWVTQIWKFQLNVGADRQTVDDWNLNRLVLCDWKRARNKRSNIFDMKSRFEMGLWLDGSDFSGAIARAIAACLKQQPSQKARFAFASSAINSTKTAERDLMTRDCATKSTGDDFGGTEWRTWRTSSEVTSWQEFAA